MRTMKQHATDRSFFAVRSLAVFTIFLVAFFVLPFSTAAASGTAITVPPAQSDQPNFGANGYVFTPSTPQSPIQATVHAVATTQSGTQRYALLFEPGTYGSAAKPLIFQVGYYTTVAGLGLSPSDVTINGAINVSNQCDSSGSCTALVNFWRSLSNLTIKVVPEAACTSSAEFWAVSQA